jgi:hypothetical protein
VSVSQLLLMLARGFTVARCHAPTLAVLLLSSTLPTLAVSSCSAHSLSYTAAMAAPSAPSRADRMRAGLLSMFVGDALSMPVHWCVAKSAVWLCVPGD